MEIRSLPCKLTETELLERGQRAAGLVDKIAIVEDARKSEAKRAKDEIDRLTGKLSDVCREVRTKTEYRDTEVKREKDYKRGVEETYRLDTGEIVETRTLTPAERQVELLVVRDGVPAESIVGVPPLEGDTDEVKREDTEAAISDESAEA